MWIAEKWQDVEVLDTGDGEKLERWGEILLCRPDPQVIWPKSFPHLWKDIHARYQRSQSGGGQWEYKKKMPERWMVNYGDMRFHIKPMGFKHTGLFPEQAVNWDWAKGKIASANRPISVLNLFGYTGGATVACAKAGATVCHVDASKGMVSWAKENCEASDVSARFIVDDALKFVQRDIRRGKTYDGIIMDPPSYGRGPNGEVWKLEDELIRLLQTCVDAMSEKPLFLILNAYTTGLQPAVLRNVLLTTVGKKFGGRATAEEIGLPVSKSDILLPCGATGRWEEA